ncbi:MAG TPA: hypothetical protein VLF89_03230 [Candidatus Saccharimonadales bacterium]|nr:hypothetical protein [Candidatus Saccharimonadales bacterium]
MAKKTTNNLKKKTDKFINKNKSFLFFFVLTLGAMIVVGSLVKTKQILVQHAASLPVLSPPVLPLQTGN